MPVVLEVDPEFMSDDSTPRPDAPLSQAEFERLLATRFAEFKADLKAVTDAELAAKDKQIDEYRTTLALFAGSTSGSHSRNPELDAIDKILAAMSRSHFDGSEPEKVEDLEYQLTKQFALRESCGVVIKEENKLSVLISCLEGDALKLARSLETSILDSYTTAEAVDPKATKPWMRLMDQLFKRFLRMDKDYRALVKLLSGQQGDRSVEEFTAWFITTTNDLPDLTLLLKKLFYMALLNEPMRGQVRAGHQKDSEMAFEDMVGLALAFEASIGPQGPSTPQFPATSVPPAATPKMHLADRMLKDGLLAAVNGWKPADVPALHKSYTDEGANPDASKLRTFLHQHKLCFLCRDFGHTREKCPQNKIKN